MQANIFGRRHVSKGAYRTVQFEQPMALAMIEFTKICRFMLMQNLRFEVDDLSKALNRTDEGRDVREYRGVARSGHAIEHSRRMAWG